MKGNGEAMLKIDNEQIYTFDVDDTLVMWGADFHLPGEGKIKFFDPYDGNFVYLKPHHQHIKLLQQMNGRGRYVVVWSAGGVKWAESVVRQLGLEAHVHMVTTKPIGYIDDLPAEKFMKNHIYLPFKGTV